MDLRDVLRLRRGNHLDDLIDDDFIDRATGVEGVQHLVGPLLLGIPAPDPHRDETPAHELDQSMSRGQR